MPKANLLLRTGEGGYTLIELLVVLAVISMLAMATPAIVSAARPGAEARAATYALANALRTARNAAIDADAEQTVLLDLKNKSYVASDGKSYQMPQGIEWEFQGPPGQSPDNDVEMRFFADGSASGGRIRITGANQCRVVVNSTLTGRISINE